MTPRPLADAIWFSKCSPTEKLVLLCIGSHAKPGGGGAYPGIRRIQKLTGVAKSTVQRTIALLVGRGYIAIVKHGNTMASNEYKINIGTLMEHEIDAPELRHGVGLLPAQGVYPPSAQGVPGGVPIREVGVGRFDYKGVPTTGTEQSTNNNNQQREQEKDTSKPLARHEDGTNLWRAAREIIKAQTNQGSYATWLGPVGFAYLEGTDLTVWIPTKDFEVIANRFDLYGALDKAAATTGINYERLKLRCKEEITIEPPTAPGVLLRPLTDSERRRQSWREKQQRSA
jgi:Helix-turn-helix domain